MRGKDLLECMEYIDDALVEEALEPAAFPRRNNMAVKWGMAAACVAVLGISAAAFWSHQNIGDARIAHPDMDTAVPQMATGGTSGNDNGSTDGSASDTQAGALAAGAGVNSESGAVSRGGETAWQSSAEDTAPDRQEAVEAAKSQDQIKESEDVQDDAKAESQPYTVISDYYGEKDDSIYDYPVPEKGKSFCYHYLQETMTHYSELGNAAGTTDSPIYAYDIVIDLYGETEKNGEIIYRELTSADNGSDRIEQEYRRLVDLGYAVRLSEDFQLTGTFTKAELDTFQASPEYGYTFRFAGEY